MKTFKIEIAKAVSLRKQLLWSNLLCLPLGFMVGVSIAADSSALTIMFGLAIVVALIWSVVAYWRALWALWEWPGIALGLAVGFCIVIMNVATGFLGSIASLAFLAYIYVQLGKQAGVPVTKREVFEET